MGVIVRLRPYYYVVGDTKLSNDRKVQINMW